MVAQCPLQQTEVDHVLPFGNADAVAKCADAFWCEAPSAQSADGGHAGVVPPVDYAFFDQTQELALGHHCVVEVQSGKLDLSAREDLQCLNEPLVEGPVHFKLQRAQRVGDAFNGITLAMGEVVHGVDAPIVPGPVVVGAFDAVNHRVTHVHVGVCHVNFGAQYAVAIRVDAGLHLLKEL